MPRVDRSSHPSPEQRSTHPLSTVPLTRDAACAFIAKHHRHHRPPVGHLFAIGAMRGAELVGILAGRKGVRSVQ